MVHHTKVIYDAKSVLTDCSIIPNHNLSKGASFGLLTEREFSTHQIALKFALIKYNSNKYLAKYVIKAFILFYQEDTPSPTTYKSTATAVLKTSQPSAPRLGTKALHSGMVINQASIFC